MKTLFIVVLAIFLMPIPISAQQPAVEGMLLTKNGNSCILKLEPTADGKLMVYTPDIEAYDIGNIQEITFENGKKMRVHFILESGSDKKIKVFSQEELNRFKQCVYKALTTSTGSSAFKKAEEECFGWKLKGTSI